jgi:hypothetical protein
MPILITTTMATINYFCHNLSNLEYLKFEVFTAVRMMMLFFWVLAPRRFVDRRVYTASKPRRTASSFGVAIFFSGLKAFLPTTVYACFH